MSKETKLSELLGIMIGDGCLCRTVRQRLIYISGHKEDDLEYHERTTKKLFKSIYNKKIKIQFRKKEKTLFIKFSDKDIFNSLKSLGIPVGKKYDLLKIPEFIKNKKLFCFFMKGLFDTDGCVVLSKQHRKIPYYPRLEIASKSQGFLVELITKLKDLGFYGSVSKKATIFRLELPGYKNLNLWIKLISMNNPKHRQKVKDINSKRL